jgi:hypothetical protein
VYARLRSRLDHRRAVRPALGEGEHAEQRDTGGEHRERPRRPAELAALDERIDDAQRRRADEDDAERVEPHALGRAGLRHEPQRAEQADQPQRHVEQEDHPPAGAEEIGRDEPAGEDRPGDRGQPHHRAERRERAAHLLRREDVLDDAEALRDQQRAEAALQHARRDEGLRRGGERAGRRREREARDPDEEDPAAAEHVAEPPSDDEEDAERERVPGGPPLHRGRAAAELGADCGGGDRDHRAVEQVHDLGDQHDGQDDPAPAVGGRVVGERPDGAGGGSCGRHGAP